MNFKKSGNNSTEPQESAKTEELDEKDSLMTPEDFKKNIFKSSPEKLDHAVENIKIAIDDALDEDTSDSVETIDSAIEGVPKKKNSFKRNMYFTIGVVVCFLSLIGFIFSVGYLANGINDIINNTKQKEQFAEFIYPVVINDPSAFEDNQHISSDVVISSAIWDIILYGNKDKYQTEYGNMTIPQVDVELHATNIFGKGLTFDHKTLGDAVLTFYYSPETKSYIVPVSPQFFPYSPLVEDIKKSGNTYTLKVGYVSPSPEWLLATKKKKDVTCDKYMEYVITVENNDYTLTSINSIQSDNATDNAM